MGLFLSSNWGGKQWNNNTKWEHPRQTARCLQSSPPGPPASCVMCFLRPVYRFNSSLRDIRYNGSHVAYICALYHIFFLWRKFNLQHLARKGWGWGRCMRRGYKDWGKRQSGKGQKKKNRNGIDGRKWSVRCLARIKFSSGFRRCRNGRCTAPIWWRRDHCSSVWTRTPSSSAP